MATKRQISSKVFWTKLTEGDYKAIIDYASQRENELDVQIRDNYLNIYYRGGNLLRVHPGHLYFDEFYFHRGAKDMRKTHLIRSDKTEDKELVASYKKKRDEMFSILEKDIAVYCAKMKGIMNEWEEDLHTIGISHDEKNAQQLISMNNRGNTEYTVIDLEYAVSRTSSFYYDGKSSKKVPRFDIIAVDKSGQLYVIELKTGLVAIKGNSGIGSHIDCYNHTIGRDSKNEFLNEMDKLLDQKRKLNLIDKNVFIDKSRRPKFIFAFSDKQGENRYEDFVEACKDEEYNDKVIYLNDDYQLK